MEKPHQQSGQHIIIAIIRLVQEIQNTGCVIHFHWVPADCGLPGNEAAHAAAQVATTQGCKPEADTGSIQLERFH